MFKITKFVHERYRASDWETSLAFFMCAQHGQQLGGESPLRAW